MFSQVQQNIKLSSMNFERDFSTFSKTRYNQSWKVCLLMIDLNETKSPLIVQTLNESLEEVGE
jgi:hypothetical protein